ncbi:MAG: helix-turn-helix domain-containing protein [Oscillospiraceae bacterium]|nr:helix-turn-helix domain-containing protein [Oscillospiraceae bacterium]
MRMNDLKQIVAANLSQLRKKQQLTQQQLAEVLHYSDKAVSKWERGESLPDLAVLKKLADLYEIKIDDLLQENISFEEQPTEEILTEEPHEVIAETESPQEPESESHAKTNTESPDAKPFSRNHFIIAGMAVGLVWLIISLMFVLIDLFVPDATHSPILFLYAAPISAIVSLIFNSIWFNPRWNFGIISFLVWTTLLSIYLTFYEYRIGKIFLIGIPAQIIILLWSRLKKTNAAQ